jgi:spore germination protein GerM
LSWWQRCALGLAALLALVGLVGCNLGSGFGSGASSAATEERGRWDAPGPAGAGEIPIYLPRWFADDTLGLQGVPRVLKPTEDPAWEVLHALIRGPTGDERAADFAYALDHRTRVRSVRLEGVTGTIDFGEGLERLQGRPFSELAYWSIVYTLTEVPGVSRVTLEQDGSRLTTFGLPAFTLPAAAAGREDAPAWAQPRSER